MLKYVNISIVRPVTRLAGSEGGNTAVISYNTAVPDEFNWVTFLVSGGMHAHPGFPLSRSDHQRRSVSPLVTDCVRVIRPTITGFSFLIFAELVTNVPLLNGTRRSITVFTKSRQYIIFSHNSSLKFYLFDIHLYTSLPSMCCSRGSKGGLNSRNSSYRSSL
jgi:hypothetical protein